MSTKSTWHRSTQLLERARRSLVGGVSSPFRAKSPVPLYFESGCGSRLWDVDGNDYIDYALAWGPLILGHCHPALVAAMEMSARVPHNYGAQHELEFLVSEMIQGLAVGAERVAFASSGSEALQIAMRLARAFTGRNKIIKFEGHYHGWLDSALLSYKPSRDQMGDYERPNVVRGSTGQVENSTENILVLPWNRTELLEAILHRNKGDVAGVMMEPVLCNSGCLMPHAGYLQEVRELCTQYQVLLIFDEVITGFRISDGGAQKHFGVVADLMTYGKALAGGLPMSAIAGRKEIMEQILTAGVVFGGTFNGNPISTSAALATLRELSKDDGLLLKQANELGRRMMRGLSEAAARHGIPVLVTGFGTAFALHFTRRPALDHYRDTLDDDRAQLNRFLLAALEEGIYLLPDGRFYLSGAHTENDVTQTLDALDRALAGSKGETKSTMC